MRTTIELTDESHRAISTLARRLGHRGLSPLIQTAVDLYLASLDAEQTADALGMEGSLTSEDAESILSVMHDTRNTWRAPG